MLAALAPYAVRRCSLSLTRSRYRATTWAGARSGRPDRMLAAVLLHASFRPRLAATPLRFANPSPPSGWVEDFHLQAVEHARHTTKKPRRGRRGSSCLMLWRPANASHAGHETNARRIAAVP